MAGASWADAGRPSHVTAAKDRDGRYALYGLRQSGEIAFRVPLPARGHAAAIHPAAPEAVAFARRPGTFALVIDCATGRLMSTLEAPAGRHFYGHGAFSRDGERLFTTENAIESGEGRVGIWARADGYRRIGEVASGGIGPHEMVRLPGTDRFAVANGGIHTHPSTGREKLNLATMRPNLAYLDEAGRLTDVIEVPAELHQNSLRHLAVRADGTIACAFQWQGDVFEAPPLLALHREGPLRFVSAPEAAQRATQGYGGSVAFYDGGRRIALSAPRGGLLLDFDAESGFAGTARQTDICGVAAADRDALATDGLGIVHRWSGSLTPLARHALAFDNHLLRIAPVA